MSPQGPKRAMLPLWLATHILGFRALSKRSRLILGPKGVELHGCTHICTIQVDDTVESSWPVISMFADIGMKNHEKLSGFELGLWNTSIFCLRTTCAFTYPYSARHSAQHCLHQIVLIVASLLGSAFCQKAVVACLRARKSNLESCTVRVHTHACIDKIYT